MKLLNLLLLTFLFPFCLISQTHAWVNTFGNSGVDRSFRLTIAPNGNVITTGLFEGTVDFNPGTGTSNSTSSGSEDIVICRYDENGNFQWAKTFGGNGIDRGLSITTDKNGNIYGTGYFSGTADFNPGTPVNNLISNGNVDIYLVKLDSAGNYKWAKSFGSSSEDRGWDLKIDSNDDIVLTGYFRGTMDFDPGSGTTNRTSKGAEDIFVLKLDTAGDFKWVNTYGSSSSSYFELGYSVDIDANDNIFLSGAFAGTVDFDPSSATYNLTSSGQEDAFITKLSSNGSLVWAKKWGGTGEDIASSLTISTKGNIYVGGLFRGTVDFDPGSGINTNTSNGHRDAFTLKLDSAGGFIWAKTIGSGSADVVAGITVDQNESVSFTGYFYGTMDCDPGSSVFNISNSGTGDGYVCQFDKDGNFVWAYSTNSTSIGITDGIISDQKGSLYIVGSFSGSNVDFDPQSTTASISSNGGLDAFIQKIRDCNDSYDTLFEQVCNAYTSPSGKYIWKNTGTYFDTLLNSIGCDSILEINLFITNTRETLDTITCNTYSSPSGYHVWDSSGTYFDTIPRAFGCDSIYTINLTVLKKDTSFAVLACKNYISPSGNTTWNSSGLYLDTLVSNQGCDSIISITLALIQPDTSVSANDPVLTSNASGTVTYQWLDCNNAYSKITGATSKIFNATYSGNFAVEVNRNGCKDTSLCYQILTIGLNNPITNNEIITVYPNPTNGVFQIKLPKKYSTTNIQYTLRDIHGKSILNGSIIGSNPKIDCNDISQGIYFLQLKLDDQSNIIEKIVIN